MALARPLRGIVPPMVTPLLTPDRLDVAGLERVVDHLLRGGMHGIFVLGTNGEGPVLPYELRREVVQRVTAQVAGRLPVLVGVTDTTYDETRRMAEFAAKAGANGIVMAPPYYYPTSQADLLRLVRGLAKDSPLPMFMYNIPRLTKVMFEPETVAAAAEIPNVHGLKDTCGDIEIIRRMTAAVKGHPDFTILVGPHELLIEGMKLGAHGGVHSGANVLPRLYAALYDACAAKRDAEAERLYSEALALTDVVFDPKDTEYRNIRGLKCALSVMGVCSDLPAWPYEPVGPERRKMIEAYVRSDAFQKWV